MELPTGGTVRYNVVETGVTNMVPWEWWKISQLEIHDTNQLFRLLPDKIMIFYLKIIGIFVESGENRK